MVRWQKGHLALETPISLISRGFLPEQLQEKDSLGNLLTQVYLELEAKAVLRNKPHAGRRKGRKMPFFVSGGLDL